MLPEILAAQGQPLGGATETANLKLLTSYENDLNTINTARNKDISEINRQIAALYDEGALKAAETEAEFGRSALDTYLGLGQAEIAYMQAAEEARKQERLVLEQQERQDYLATITRYSADYQAEINRLKAQGYDDSHWKIQYLQAARQGKLDDLARAQAEALALEEERAYELQKIAYSKSFSGSGSGGSSLPTVSQAIDNISSGYGSEIDYYVYNQSAGSNYSPSNPPTWAKNVTNPYGLTPQESAYASGDRSAATVSGIKHLTATEMENLDWQVGLILQNNGETSYFGETMYAPQSVDDAYRLLASYVDSGRITELEADAVLRRYFPNMPIVKGR
jgi:hypothetical protein